MKLQFDKNQSYQLDAIQSIVDLFEGQDLTQDLIQKLKEIISGAITENKINVEQLKQILGEAINTDAERYQLSWAGKSEAYKILQTPTTETLIPNFEGSVNWDSASKMVLIVFT